jgi:hypothetical protein
MEKKKEKEEEEEKEKKTTTTKKKTIHIQCLAYSRFGVHSSKVPLIQGGFQHDREQNTRSVRNSTMTGHSWGKGRRKWCGVPGRQRLLPKRHGYLN